MGGTSQGTCNGNRGDLAQAGPLGVGGVAGPGQLWGSQARPGRIGMPGQGGRTMADPLGGIRNSKMG